MDFIRADYMFKFNHGIFLTDGKVLPPISHAVSLFLIEVADVAYDLKSITEVHGLEVSLQPPDTSSFLGFSLALGT